MKGIYCLIIFLNRSQKIKIGKRVGFFTKGYYCYVGSAKNNLEKRIERHLRNKKKKYWHIDYFLEKSEIKNIVVLKTSRECELSRKLENMKEEVVLKGFGSSDCNCPSHLFRFSYNPMKKEKFNKIFKNINKTVSSRPV